MIVGANEKDLLRKTTELVASDGKLHLYMPYIIETGEAIEEDREGALYYLDLMECVMDTLAIRHKEITEEVLPGDKVFVVVHYTIPLKDKKGNDLFDSEMIVYPTESHSPLISLITKVSGRVNVATEFLYSEMEPLELIGVVTNDFKLTDLDTTTNIANDFNFDITFRRNDFEDKSFSGSLVPKE